MVPLVPGRWFRRNGSGVQGFPVMGFRGMVPLVPVVVVVVVVVVQGFPVVGFG
jgi:hypothetical protein